MRTQTKPRNHQVRGVSSYTEATMRTFTARQAAERLRVHRTTVLYWRSHGWLDTNGQRHHLTPVGTDPLTGATLFPEHELLDAERDTRRKAQRSHRASRRLAAA